MPTGPKGQKRPGDVIGAAIMAGTIVTGKVEEGGLIDDGNPAAKALGPKGGAARAKAMTLKRRADCTECRE